MANIPFLNNAYFSSKIGIGELNPVHRLSIKTTDDTRGILIYNTLASSYAEAHFKANREYRIGTGGSTSAIEARNNFYIYDASAGAHRVTLNSSGNFGIGTTSPDARLDVNGGLNSAHAIFSGQDGRGLKISTENTLNNDDGVVYDAQTSTGQHLFKVSGSEKMRINSTGNVGIGSIAPISYSGYSSLTIGGTFGTTKGLIKFGTGTSNDGPEIFTNTNKDLYFNKAGSGTNLILYGTGVIRFNNYNSTNQTGTPTYILGTDVSGNVVKVLGGDIPGLDDGPYLPLTAGSTKPLTGDLYINSGKQLRLYRSDNASYARFDYSGSSVGLDIDDLNGDGINLQQAGVNKLRIETSGNATFAGSIDTTAVNIKVGSAIHGTITSSSNSLTLNARNTGITLFQSGGSEKMRIASNGNVGIGTTIPAVRLDFGSSTGKAFHLYTSALDYYGFNMLSYDAGPFSTNIISGNGGEIKLRTASGSTTQVTRLTVASGGNVGIGTTSPTAAKLVIIGNGTNHALEVRNTSTGDGIKIFTANSTANNGLLWFQGTSALVNFYSSSSNFGILEMNNVNTNTVKINSGGSSFFNGGNVGINTTNPIKKLHVKDTSGSFEVALFETDKGGSFVRNIDSLATVETGVQGGKWSARTSNIQRLVIDSTGNVGIGTTNPTQLLHVSSTTSNPTGIGLQNSQRYYSVRSNNFSLVFTDETVGSERMRIASNGNVGIGTTSPDGVLHIKKDNATATFEIQGGLNSITAVDQIHAEINFGANDGSVTGGIAGSIKSITEFSNGAYAGLAFYTGRQSRTPYLQRAMQIKNTGAISFGSGPDAYGTSGQVLQSNGGLASPTWVAAGTPGSGIYLPLVGGTMTGNLKLNDNVNLYLGTGNDFQAYHDGSNTYLRNLNGNFIIKQDKVDADLILECDNGSGGTTRYLTLNGAVGSLDAAVELRFPDGIKAKFGSSQDLQIYHDGNNSFIDNSTGNLTIDSGTHLLLKTATGESLANFFANGANELFYDNSKKLSTGSVNVGTDTTAGGTLIDGWKTTTQANAIDDTTIATTAYVNNKIQLIPAGLIFQGTWNAATNTPTLTSGSGTTGHFYIVSVAGSTNLDGITDWKVGDWAVFIEQGASDQWEKIDNSSVLDGFGTGGSVAGWSGSGTSNTLTNAPITFSGNNSTFAGNGIFSGNVNPSGSIRVAGGSDQGSQLCLFADSNGATSLAGFTFEINTGGNNSRTRAFLIDQSKNATFAGNGTFAGRILNTYTGTGFHELQNGTNNGIVLRLTSTGDNRALTLQSDHIYSNGNFFIGDNSYQTNFRGSIYDFANGNANFAQKVNIGTTVPTALLNVADDNATNVKVTRIGRDTTTVYQYSTSADAVLEWTCGSYHNAEVVITASQTNSGTYNNLYIRGIWTNNHTFHSWDELEHIGGLTGTTFTITNGQNGSTTNSGRLTLTMDYVNGSFATLNVRITDFFGTHSYTIT